MTREEREQALEWFKNRPITMSGAKKMYDLAISALEQPEPCEDTISRQAAIDIVDFECGEWRGLEKTIEKRLSDLPSAQPMRPKGKWIRRLVDSGFNADWYCSKCGWKTALEEHGYNYCPNCGAKMMEEKHEIHNRTGRRTYQDEEQPHR